MIRITPLLFALFLLTACDSGSTNSESATTEAAKPTLSPDSLRQLYQAYQALQVDPMPTQQRLEQGKLYPVDEAPLDTAFFVFRQQLLDKIDEKDVFGLLDAVAEDVEVDGAKTQGMAGFVSHFQLDSKTPDTLAIWDVLGRTLREGGAFSDKGKRFEAPYYIATWPASEYPPEQYVTITGTGVRMRNSPGLNGQILTTLSYNPIVKLVSYEAEEEIGGALHPWVQIALENGTKGYVFGQFVGSPLGPKLTFARTANRWQLVAVAGFAE
jgi:hypothetical protein